VGNPVYLEAEGTTQREARRFTAPCAERSQRYLESNRLR
jgi:hypothetical protein